MTTPTTREGIEQLIFELRRDPKIHSAHAIARELNVRGIPIVKPAGVFGGTRWHVSLINRVLKRGYL